MLIKNYKIKSKADVIYLLYKNQFNIKIFKLNYFILIVVILNNDIIVLNNHRTEFLNNQYLK